jgi:acyl-CoA thioesterase FadM
MLLVFNHKYLLEKRFIMSNFPLTGIYSSEGIYKQRLAVRPYEPHGNGILDASGLLRYCEIVANAASTAAGFGAQWYFSRGEAWVIYRHTIELVSPVEIGDEIHAQTWVHTFSRVSSQRNYLLLRARDEAPIARAATLWAYVDRERQSPIRIPAEVKDRFPLVSLISLRERPAIGEPLILPIPSHTFRLRARAYETDPMGHINNCVYADWLSEAARLAFDKWTNAIDPRLAALSFGPLRPRRITINYQRSALPGDPIIITTTPERIASSAIVLNQTISRAGEAEQSLVTATATYFKI